MFCFYFPVGQARTKPKSAHTPSRHGKPPIPTSRDETVTSVVVRDGLVFARLKTETRPEDAEGDGYVRVPRRRRGFSGAATRRTVARGARAPARPSGSIDSAAATCGDDCVRSVRRTPWERRRRAGFSVYFVRGSFVARSSFSYARSLRVCPFSKRPYNTSPRES